jgi:potassium/hydrogen antiporter
MELATLIAALLAIGAILSTRFAQRFGVPTLVLFVGVGMLAGSSGPLGIVFENYSLAYNAGLLALAVILFSGGLDTQSSLFRASLLPASLLSTLGVLLTALMIGAACWFFTPLGFLEGLLLGAVLAPTDAAAVFSALKGRGLPRRLRGILEAESGTNDPVGIYLTLALTAFIATGQGDVGSVVSGIVVQLALGGLLGYLFGRGLVWLINRVRIEAFGLYPMLALAGGLLCYAATSLVGGNGFLAIYVAGMVLGNAALVHQQNIMNFMDGIAWGAQIVMFLLLGLLVFPDRLPGILPYALLITFVAMFIARPFAVLVTLLPFQFFGHKHRFSLREQTLIGWAGLKGAVPIILATVPLLNEIAGGERIFNIVFVVVVVGTTLQGLTIGPLAKRLGLAEPEPPAPPVRIELGGAAPPNSAIFDVFLTPKSQVVGKALAEVALSPSIVVTAVYRDDELIAPRGDTVFEAGDHVFVLNSDTRDSQLPTAFTDSA